MLPKLPKKFSKMWIQLLNLEQTLFPEIKEQLGILSEKEKRLIRVLDFANIEEYSCDIQITNPPKDRKEIARAFIAKQVYNLHTTRDLIDRLKVDRRLRLLCGWRHLKDIPHESKFSRVFNLLSKNKAAARAHERFVKEYLGEEIFFYHATDSTAIELREKPLKKETLMPKEKKKRGRPKKGEKREPKESILQKQQKMESTKEMLSLISTATDVGIKQNAKGHRYQWIGGKLHLGVVDGDIPISAIYSSASVHDSSVALPLMNESSAKVTYLYDLNDSAYHAEIIENFSQSKGHVQIVDINPKNSQTLHDEKEGESILRKLGFQTRKSNHYGHRSSVERVNGNLKDNYGCQNIYYQGATKVSSVLNFAVLSLCIVQSLKLLT